MNIRKYSTLIVLSLLIVLTSAATIFADEFDQATRLTVDQSIAIPGHVLPAGSYWFVRANHGEGSAENAIQVWDGERKKLIATLQVGNVHQAKASGHVLLTFADRSPDPIALLDLTYPGHVNGQMYELLYPERERKALSETPKLNMKVGTHGVIEKEESENH